MKFPIKTIIAKAAELSKVPTETIRSPAPKPVRAVNARRAAIGVSLHCGYHEETIAQEFNITKRRMQDIIRDRQKRMESA